jgi:LuxR family transcriptional regulator, maltose regulon positive regulatory protein
VGAAAGSQNAAHAASVLGEGVVPRAKLFEQLSGGGRVAVVSAAAGSGKTLLLRSWIRWADLGRRAAWVQVADSEGCDGQRFWLSVADAVRGTVPGSELVRGLTAAPDLDGWGIAERLLKDLAPLDEPLWLVIDDLHELGATDALRQLELVVMRAPAHLRFVLATRHDVALRLHRLRLEGELTELRTADLHFTLEEARALFEAAGVALPEPTLAVLHEQTEGWAAGLRLAALSLAGHPDPERFAEEFSGSERTVAGYLLAEVLDRQSPEARRLLLRTSVLERVNGELAEVLGGGSGGERVLDQLEQANAFVVALDAGRSWFRYHHLFAELLRRELRHTAPDEVTALHRAAAEWFAGHGWPVEAIRHAQAAQDWALAARLLADNSPGLQLDGQAATVHTLLAAFPADAPSADPELATVAAFDQLAHWSLEAAERYARLAERGAASVAPARRGRVQVLCGIVRLLLARGHGDLPAVAEQARRLQAVAEAPDTAHPGLGEDLRAVALISLGITEMWASRFDEAERHLEQGVTLAQRIGRPFLEFNGLAHRVGIDVLQSFARAAERGRQAVELARQHGWTDDPAAGIASVYLGAALYFQGRLAEAEPWIQRAERTVTADAQPAARLAVHYLRGLLELAHGRNHEALTGLQSAERLTGLLAGPHFMTPATRARILHALVRLGDTERAERTVAELAEPDRARGEIHVAIALLRLAQQDPRAATEALAPVLDGSATVTLRTWPIEAHVVEAIARDMLGDRASSGQAMERALDLAEPEGALLPFLLHPAPGLLERHARERTSHGALLAEIRGLLAGRAPASPSAAPQPPLEPLSDSEIRVLRYLPTNLSMSEIGGELYVSMNTVRTHLRHLYIKLGTHRRADAVERARALGLLAPSARR